MSMIELKSKSPTERQPGNMRSSEMERVDEVGQGVGPVGEAESLGWILRLACPRRVPRHHRELVGQTVDLTAPLPAV
jgi:hypothetical protein